MGLLLGVALAGETVPGGMDAGLPDDVMDWRLEELMAIEVTSVSKKRQKLSGAPAAIHVITGEEIRRSGATSIAEALRLAPGLHVARIDANKWAIGCRGFSERFANKLLVLLDGRSIYNPVFSGVFWEVQDTVLEDIDRIEIIRGPGGTLWGANAVNGVINIITKRAAETQGGLVSLGGGTEEQAFGQVRYGGPLGDEAHFRVYAKGFERDSFVDEDGHEANDDWRMLRAGFRMDFGLSADDTFTLQGDVYEGRARQRLTRATFVAPFAETFNDDIDLSGLNLLARWERVLGERSNLALQFYYDQAVREEELYRGTTHTFDLDFQHHFCVGDSHELVWGLGLRLNTDSVRGSQTLSLDPQKSTDDLWSAFVQDEISLVENQLYFTLGCKLEHNDFTGFEYQPSVRLLYTPSPRHSVWAAVSRAVRTPSRVDDAIQITMEPVVGLFPQFSGSRDFESEDLLAYELGYRVQASSRVSIDIAAFYNLHDDLRTGELGAAFIEPAPAPHPVLPASIDNKMDGHTYGVEATARWQINDWWDISVGYTFLKMHLDLDHDSTDLTAEQIEHESPENQVLLRSSMSLPGNLLLDVSACYVDHLSQMEEVGSRVDLDARLAWRVRDGLEVFVVGQCLLAPHHREYAPKWIAVQPTEPERAIHAGLTWQF